MHLVRTPLPLSLSVQHCNCYVPLSKPETEMQRECTPTQQEEEEEEGSRPRSQLTGIIYIAPERVWALFSEVLETHSQLPDHVEHPCRAHVPTFPLWPTARTLYWGSPHLFLVAFREINSINWLSLLSIECIHKAFFREFHLFIHSHTQRHTDTHKHSHTLSHRHATVHTHRHIHLQMATTLLWLRLFFVVNAAIRCH